MTDARARGAAPPAGGEPGMAELLEPLWQRKLALSAWALAGAVLALLVSLLLPPAYLAEARVVIEDQNAKGGLLSGLANATAGLGLGTLLEAAPSVSTEMQIVRSRAIVTPVVAPPAAPSDPDAVGLDLCDRVDDLDDQTLWKSYWRKLTGAPEPRGTLGVEIRRWDFEDDTALLLELRAADEVEIGFARLFDRRARTLAFRPGEPLEFEGATLVLSPADLAPGRSFRVSRTGFQKTVDEFLKRMIVRESERGSSVLAIAYPAPDGERSARIVNALVRSYTEYNRLRQVRHADRSSGLLSRELERVRSDLAQAEEDLIAYGKRAGTIALPETAAAMVETLAEVDLERARAELEGRSTAALLERVRRRELAPEDVAALELVLFPSEAVTPLSELMAQAEALAATYNEEWPELRAIRIQVEHRYNAVASALERQAELSQDLAANYDEILERYTREMQSYPETEVELLRHNRKVEAFSKIYLYLLGEVQQAQINEASAVPKIDVLDWAVAPLKRKRPSLRVNLALGAIVGLVLGVGLVYFREHRRTFEARAAALPLAGLEHLGTLSRRSGGRARPLPVRDAPESRAADDFRALRSAFLHAAKTAGATSVAVCSARAGEGRTRVASNLAAALARAGLSVLLVEADARRPALAVRFGKPAAPGLSELLQGRAELAALDLSSGVAGLEVLVGGAAWPGVADRLASAEGVALFAGLTAGRDHVLIDTPPLLESADGAAVAAAADGVLFLAGSRASEADVEEALSRLRRAGARVLAAAANRWG